MKTTKELIIEELNDLKERYILHYIIGCYRSGDYYCGRDKDLVTDGPIEELFDILEDEDLLTLLEDFSVTVGSCCNTYYLTRIPKSSEKC